MLVVFDSLTGQGERFARKLEEPVVDLLDFESTSEPILLVTRSWDFGKITDEAREFLENHANQVIGVCVSGNRNWGTNYGAAGDKINLEYGIELVAKFEGSGFSMDIDGVKDWIDRYKKGKGDIIS